MLSLLKECHCCLVTQQLREWVPSQCSFLSPPRLLLNILDSIYWSVSFIWNHFLPALVLKKKKKKGKRKFLRRSIHNSKKKKKFKATQKSINRRTDKQVIYSYSGILLNLEVTTEQIIRAKGRVPNSLPQSEGPLGRSHSLRHETMTRGESHRRDPPKL